ncbi:MAG: alpha/beta hydrolase [Rickettsiales bacterium]
MMSQPVRKPMLYFFLTIAALYLMMVTLLFVFQRSLIYHPSRDIVAPHSYGLAEFQDIRIQTTDNVSIQMWYRPAKAGYPTIAYFHGNAGNLGDRSLIFSALADQGFGVLGTGYRGYGKSDGAPSEQGLYADARAAISYLTNTVGLSETEIILYGESLGTGVATQMATEYKVGMLALQAPYRSLAGRAAEIYFYVPVKLLIKDKLYSIKKIARVQAPLLVFHGELDNVIPLEHGKSIYEAATSPKRAFFLPHVGHNDFDSNAVSAHLLDFAKEHGLVK